MCQSVCSNAALQKTITSRKRQVHLTPLCHGHEGNTGDITGGIITNNVSSPPRCLLRTAARQRDQVKRFTCTRGGEREEGKTHTQKETNKKSAADYNQSATTEFALGGAESMGQYWAASFPSRAAFASV